LIGMAMGERFRSGGARGIARFLADHQHCDAGFDVRRDETGTGRLRITCLGCGATVDYRAAEAGELAAGPPVQTAENGEPEGSAEPVARAAPPPVPAPPRSESGRPAPLAKPRRSRIPRWVSAALIGALIIGGLVMVAIGVLRDDGEQAGTATQPEVTQPEAAPPQSAPPESTAPENDQPGTEAAQLKRRRFADRFTIGIPPGWDRGVEGGAVVIIAPGATAELNVFFESGGRPARQLARSARSFLSQRHGQGQVGKTRPVPVGARRGLQVRITYPAGEEIAVVVSAKGFSYLVLRRVDRGASADIGRQADAALASFRPR
jgi:hypothetical protein